MQENEISGGIWWMPETTRVFSEWSQISGVFHDKTVRKIRRILERVWHGGKTGMDT